MKSTNWVALIGLGVFVAAASLLLVARFYGSMSSVPISVALMLWAMTILCVLLAVRLRGRIRDEKIGQDRSQLNPVTAAEFLIVGKTSAWTGALFGGAYTGMACYVVAKYSELAAAAQDTPVVVAAALGGVGMSAAGYWLEKCCTVPPPPQGEGVR